MKKKDNNKTVVSEKTYTITCKQLDDGTTDMVLTCIGFNSYELLGVLSIAKKEVIKNMTP